MYLNVFPIDEWEETMEKAFLNISINIAPSFTYRLRDTNILLSSEGSVIGIKQKPSIIRQLQKIIVDLDDNKRKKSQLEQVIFFFLVWTYY